MCQIAKRSTDGGIGSILHTVQWELDLGSEFAEYTNAPACAVYDEEGGSPDHLVDADDGERLCLRRSFSCAVCLRMSRRLLLGNAVLSRGNFLCVHILQLLDWGSELSEHVRGVLIVLTNRSYGYSIAASAWPRG